MFTYVKFTCMTEHFLVSALSPPYSAHMQQDEAPEAGWRGSRDLWLSAAYDALIDQGIEAVKIQPLAARLKLSRTSFYWFFKDRADLLSALIDMWAGRTTTTLVTAAASYAETETEALLNFTACFLHPFSFDDRLEFAVRGWALQDSSVLARLRAADAERLAAIRDMLLRWGHSALQADVRSRAIYLVQIGYISLQTRETLEVRLARVPTYMQIFSGSSPSDSEIARFRANLLAAKP